MGEYSARSNLYTYKKIKAELKFFVNCAQKIDFKFGLNVIYIFIIYML